MKKTYCDLCKKEMPVKIPPLDCEHIDITVMMKGYYYELCDECKDSLVDWLNGRGKSESNN